MKLQFKEFETYPNAKFIVPIHDSDNVLFTHCFGRSYYRCDTADTYKKEVEPILKAHNVIPELFE
jgi:hypothetical protein